MKRFLIIAAICLIPAQTLAISADLLHSIKNDSVRYNQNDVACGAAGSDQDPPGGDVMEKAFRYFVGKGLSAAQSAGIVGNFIQESSLNVASHNTGGGPSPISPGSIIPGETWYGGGLAQWEDTYNSAHPSVRDASRWTGASGFLNYVAGKGTFAGHPQGDGKTWKIVLPQVSFVWWEMNNNNKSTLPAVKGASTPEDAAEAFELNFEGTATPVMEKRRSNARQVFDMANAKHWAQFTDTPAPAPGAAVSVCGNAAGAASGGVIGVATGPFTWPTSNCVQTTPDGEKRTSCFDYRAAYGPAMVHPGGEDPYTDCGTFVATVMRKSGADPKYPVVGTGTQRSYLLSLKGTMYEVNENPATTSDVHPGDIMVYYDPPQGHTQIYVGPGQPNGEVVAAASWHGHTPALEGIGAVVEMLGKPGVIVAHIK